MRRRLFAGASIAFAFALTASTALAHQGNINFRSELDGVEPPVPGLDVQVLNYDDSLQLQNRTGETVVVDGYDREPYVRISPDGAVAVNTRSPAYYLNDDRYGNAPVPAAADSDAAPEWRVVDRTGQYVWHDHRIHYMSTGTPAQVSDPDQRTKIFDYRLPIEVGDRRATIDGTLFWVGEAGGFPVLPFIGLGAVALAGAAAIAIRRRRRAAGAPTERDASSGPQREAW